MISDFKAFLIKQNVLSLAIAVVVGTALNALVKSVVDDFIMPIVAAALPGGEWQKATLDLGPIKFGVGNFFATLLNFLIVGFVAWRIAKALIKPEAPPVSAPTKDCQFCRMTIDKGASRCPHCTSALGAVA
jgi:large conductance mechanosensitive channel